MLAHNFDKSRFGAFGFDVLDLYTEDEIYCTGFTPSDQQIESIGQFVENLSSFRFKKFPICLYINRRHQLYFLDLKVDLLGDPIFIDCQETTLSKSLESLQSKLLDQVPRIKGGFEKSFHL